MKSVRCGIDSLKSFLNNKITKEQRVGVLCHPSSVDKNYQHIIEILESESNLVKLFGPQHGINCETQDNMIEWEGYTDAKGRPVYSLYGETRIPKDEWVQDLDWMIIDLFDVGARLYTYVYTMSYMMEVCGRNSVNVVICDRPNPIDGVHLEGNILDPNFRSFVGLHEIPMRHGMTIGELALLFATRMKTPPKVKVLKCKNWDRKQSFDQTGLQWILPSPNMPSYSTARVFPGMVFLEATSLSEGRGTTRPFELIGAPFFNWDDIEKSYKQIARKLNLPPVHFHRQNFIPTFHKYAGQTCQGALQIPLGRKDFKSVYYAVTMLWILRKLYGDEWSWKQPPYEYELEKLPVDILAGNADFRECVDEQSSLKTLFRKWKDDENRFKSLRKSFLLY